MNISYGPAFCLRTVRFSAPWPGGWQVNSHRALDQGRSRYLDGKLIQPYHPLAKAARVKLRKGEIAPVDVEIIPTAAKILPGRRLRIAVQTVDVPQLLPVLPDSAEHADGDQRPQLGEDPSQITIPARKD